MQPDSLRTSLSRSRKPTPEPLLVERVMLTLEEWLQSIIRLTLSFPDDG